MKTFRPSRVRAAILAPLLAAPSASFADFDLVNNFAEPVRGATPITSPEYWAAQSFIPDAQAYLLSSIEANAGGAAGDPFVVAELRSATATGEMDLTAGGLLTTFTAPDLTGAGSARLFTPAGIITLQPETRYWFVLGSTNTGTYDWSYAENNNSIGPGTIGPFADSADAGAIWRYDESPYPYFIKVNVNPAGSEWNLDGSGDWHIADNWTGGVPDGTDAVASFLGVITAARTVYADANISLGTVRFDNANTYHLTGTGSLAMDSTSASAMIDVVQGSHKINLPLFLMEDTTASVASGAALLIADPMTLVAGSSLTKTGDGVLSIEAPVQNAGTAEMEVAGGTVVLGYPIGEAASPGTAAEAHLSIAVTGSKLIVAAPQVLLDLDAATANPGDQEIDLAGAAVHLYSADLAATELQVYSDIQSALLSASGLDGLHDSTTPDGNHALGVTDQAVDAHGDANVLVRLTRAGDATLDGIVNVGDLGALATNWQQPGLWDNGDFNFDGTINVGDLGILATNWQQSADGTGFAEALAAIGLPYSAAVPEPAMAGLLAIVIGLRSLRSRSVPWR